MKLRLKIGEYRTDAGITQMELGLMTELHQHQIAQYETGKNVPGIVNLWKIANALGCYMDDLVEVVEEE